MRGLVTWAMLTATLRWNKEITTTTVQLKSSDQIFSPKSILTSSRPFPWPLKQTTCQHHF